MKTLITVALCVAAFAVLSSCNIAGTVGYLLTPDPEQEALFTLPNRRTVVFVDDRRSVMHPTRLRMVIADHVTAAFIANKVVSTIISPKDVMRASAANDRHNAPLSVAELGEAVDASIVIYIEMSSFGLTSDGQTASPRASCSVRVVDVENRARLFPVDQAAIPVHATLEHIDPHRISTGGEVRKLAEDLAGMLGDQVAKVFYTHSTGRLGENLKRK